MKKQVYITELQSIQNMLGKVRTINEAIMFNEDYDEYEGQEMDPEEGMSEEGMPEEGMPQEEMPMNNPEGVEKGQDMGKMDPEEQGMAELDEMGEIDKIREITLSGMHKLCKNPQDPQYQALKKIFQMCDKGVDEEIKQQKGV